MAYQVLARKYRPQRFSDVVGQEHVTRTLGNALEQQRVAHGYIFSGHRGIGKTTIARILAMALNCRKTIGSEQRPTPEPCGTCESCQEIRAGGSMDVVEIDAATNRGIDEIRELRDAARYAPARDRYKIYLLDEAHQITDAAFNALLKILEEPPEHVVFMMATTQPEDIPQTIRSRCQHFSFHAVKFDDIVAQLTQIASQENIAADAQALSLLAEAGDGSMRDALSIMDQAIASAPVLDGRARLDGEEIRELMGVVPDAVFEHVLEGIGEGRSAAVMGELNRLLSAGNSPSQLARQMVRYLRNCLMVKLGGERTELVQISEDERARANRSAALFSEEDLTRFVQVMLRTFDDLNYRQEPRLHLELGLMKLVHLQRLLPLEQILSSLPGAAASATPRATGSTGPTGPTGTVRSASSSPPQATGPSRSPVRAPDRNETEARSASTPPREVSFAGAEPAQDPPPAEQRAPTPFEIDAQRKSAAEPPVELTTEVAPEDPVAPQPARLHLVPAPTEQPSLLATEEEPLTVIAPPQEPPVAAETPADKTLEHLRDVVAAALDEHGHNTAASLLAAGQWTRVEDGAIQVVVGVKKTMLGLTMNGEAWKIVTEALRKAGSTQKMTVVPGEAGQAGKVAPRRGASDSIEAVALGNPLVQQAQKLFQAEVRSVLDLRESPETRGRS